MNFIKNLIVVVVFLGLCIETNFAQSPDAHVSGELIVQLEKEFSADSFYEEYSTHREL